MSMTFKATAGAGDVDYSNWEDRPYTLELAGMSTVPNKFYKAGEDDGSTPEQWQWQWIVTDVDGTQVRNWTNTTFGKGSTARHIVGCLVGHEIQEGEEVSLNDLIGKRLRAMVTLDPASGYPRIKGGKAAFIMPRSRAQAALPAAPAPPRPALDPATGQAVAATATVAEAAGQPATERQREQNAIIVGQYHEGVLDDWCLQQFGVGLAHLTRAQAGQLLVDHSNDAIAPVPF